MTTNNFKPILFNTEMVQAILARRKTQTRRIVKLDTGQLIADTVEQISSNYFFFKKDNEAVAGRSPKYQIGDNLWVREKTIQNNISEKFLYGDEGELTAAFSPFLYKKRSSIHMPKEAARIFLKVTNVRCERLQDISEEDAVAEGIDRFENSLFNETRYRDYTDGKRRDRDFKMYPELAKEIGYSHFGGNPWPDWRDPITSFQTLWDSINAKKHPWESNPWVWVYDFERIEKPENFNL